MRAAGGVTPGKKFLCIAGYPIDTNRLIKNKAQAAVAKLAFTMIV